MIYNITDSPKTFKELILYSIQQLLAVFVATVLIAQICGTPISSCLFSAGIATLVYQVVTKFKSPMFISSCGATCTAVIGALMLKNYNNYLPVVIGGLIIFIIYYLFSRIVKVKGVQVLNDIFPAIIVGPVTIIIGLNLATFIPTYVQVQGQHSNIGILVAILTMLVISTTSHYFKGFLKTIPFLIGLIFGYFVCILLTIFGIENLIDFSIFQNMKLFQIPDFTFKYISFNDLSLQDILKVIILFTPVSICALLEHYSDHKVLSNIIGTDLTYTPGLHKTLVGDGLASFIGTILCGLPNTSYGESIATTGFSKVASVKVISTAAIILSCLSFIYPIQVFIQSIPSCVFGGCAMILYGYIALSGLKTLFNAKCDLENNKNLIIISVILTVGVSGIFLFHESFTGVSLSMLLGVLLNTLLKHK